MKKERELKLGSSYADKHNPGDGYRAERRLLRVLTFATVMLSLSLFVLAVGISDLAPLRRDVPYLVQVADRGEQVARIRPLRDDVARRGIIAEALVVEYVRYRHEFIPDAAVMNRRWGTSCLKGEIAVDDQGCAFMYKHSTPEVYRVFRARNQKQVARMMDKKIYRRVSFETSPIDKGDGVYEIRFTLRDQQESGRGKTTIIRRRRFIALVWTTFAVQKTRYEERYLNPFGFKVTRYRLAAVESEQKPPGIDKGGKE